MSDRIIVHSLPGTQVEAGNGRSRVVLDMSPEDGGKGDGLGPHETLLSALGGCTTMTLFVYARRKQWPLEGVELSLDREKPAAPGAPTRITVSIKLLGPLDTEQRARLADVAKKCPVYKTLSGPIEIVEALV